MLSPIRFIRQWWTSTNDKHLLDAQYKLLSSLVKSPIVASERWQNGLNTVEFRATINTKLDHRQKKLPTVILLHGFGSGLGFFFRNIDPLLESGRVGRVILVDWLGMGGSERPPCRRPIRGLTNFTTSLCQSRFTPSQAVDFFLDPLREWMIQKQQGKIMGDEEGGGGEPIWLVGHSLGGYLAARFALEQTKTTAMATKSYVPVEKLVLASPVGFPRKPANILSSAQLPTAFRLIDVLWSSNVTPQQLVRMMGATRGRNAVRRALVGRIPHLLDQSGGENNESSLLDLLTDYLFHITVAHPSGEFAMNSLLEPGISPDTAGVFAREPLEPLFHEYAKNIVSHGHRNNNNNNNNNDGENEQLLLPSQIKVLFGDSDWMRPNQPSAMRAMECIQTTLNDNPHAAHNVSIIPNAGHHLYLDNAECFVQHILQ